MKKPRRRDGRPALPPHEKRLNLMLTVAPEVDKAIRRHAAMLDLPPGRLVDQLAAHLVDRSLDAVPAEGGGA